MGFKRAINSLESALRETADCRRCRLDYIIWRWRNYTHAFYTQIRSINHTGQRYLLGSNNQTDIWIGWDASESVCVCVCVRVERVGNCSLFITYINSNKTCSCVRDIGFWYHWRIRFLFDSERCSTIASVSKDKVKICLKKKKTKENGKDNGWNGTSLALPLGIQYSLERSNDYLQELIDKFAR